MVNVKPFKFSNYADLVDLLKSQKYQGVEEITYRTLPKIGFIAYVGKEPIAAGFLRRLEPCYAHIDTLVSNAHFGSKVRHEGVSAVVEALLAEAERLNLAGVLATTADASILKRAEEKGFHVVNQTVIGKSFRTK